MLRFDNELILEEGMVFSMEPGIYIPGLGYRPQMQQ
ncbi:MAG: M24 family metallopeptidase [Intestinibacter sp.]